MLCLAVSDLHYDLRKFDWLVSVAPRFDAVIVAGDHLDIASTVGRPAQAILVQKYFKRISDITTLVVSSGNHDLDTTAENGELSAHWLANVRHLGIPTDGDVTELDRVTFSICPWIDGIDQMSVQAERFRRDAARRSSLWVWVYHSPPDASPTSWGRGRFWGDPWLKDWIEEFQPDIVLTGHVHEAPFMQKGRWHDLVGRTWVFNAGHQIGPVPAFLVIDTVDQTVTWSSQAGTEQVSIRPGEAMAHAQTITPADVPALIARAGTPGGH